METVRHSGTVGDSSVSAPRVHDVSSSFDFLQNWFVLRVLEVASWKCSNYTLERSKSLGPIVMAGETVH